MESIGEKLIHRREEKNCTVEQVARETHIAKRFIEALEQELFDEFPGDSYLIGFLRKYSEYLDLDASEMISLYQNTQIQEQPSPMDELLDTKPKVRWGVIIAIAVVLVIGGGAAFLLPMGEPSGAQTRLFEAERPQTEENLQLVSFSAEIIEQEFQANTAIAVTLDDQDYQIILRETGSPLILHIGDVNFSLEVGSSGFIDLNRDDSPDLRIIFQSIMDNGNPVLRLDKVVGAVQAETASSEGSEGSISTGTSSDPNRLQPVRRISLGTGQESVFVEAVFRGPVFFRYQDEAGNRTEQLYNSGERFQLDFTEGAYFWISNGGAVQFSIAGQNLRLGGDGEAVALHIARTGNELELIPMY